MNSAPEYEDDPEKGACHVDAKLTRSSGIVVITGASAGVGRATVREFSRRRAWVALLARSRDGLEAAGGKSKRPEVVPSP